MVSILEEEEEEEATLAFSHTIERGNTPKNLIISVLPLSRKRFFLLKELRFMECNKVLLKFYFSVIVAPKKSFFSRGLSHLDLIVPFFHSFIFLWERLFVESSFRQESGGGNFRKRFCAPAGTLSSHAVFKQLTAVCRTNEFPRLI